MLILMSSAAFEMTLSVVPGDIDEQNHVNNTVYLRWVQEVATAHWEAIADSEAQEGIGWVVLRHEIDYKNPACLGDDVVLRTWVGKATRLTFERFTEIRRSSDGQRFVLWRVGLEEPEILRFAQNDRTLWVAKYPTPSAFSRE
jgi:acyl-CoA thioester hydrolase